MRHHANKALSYLAGTLLFLSVAPAQAQTSSKGRSDKAISMTIPEQPVQTALKQFFQAIRQELPHRARSSGNRRANLSRSPL